MTIFACSAGNANNLSRYILSPLGFFFFCETGFLYFQNLFFGVVGIQNGTLILRNFFKDFRYSENPSNHRQRSFFFSQVFFPTKLCETLDLIIENCDFVSPTMSNQISEYLTITVKGCTNSVMLLKQLIGWVSSKSGRHLFFSRVLFYQRIAFQYIFGTFSVHFWICAAFASCFFSTPR
jgi:hypothetical protein